MRIFLTVFLFTTFCLYSQSIVFNRIGEFEYGFSEINDFVIDSAGNYYMLDSKDNCIYKYSVAGEYMKTISRKGKGPGELLMPLLLELDKNDNIIVSNLGNSRFEILSSDGDFISSFNFPSSLFGTPAFKINSQNELIVAFNDNYEGKYYIQKWALEGSLIKEICEFQKPIYSELIKHPEVPQKLLLNIDDQDNIYVAFSDEKKVLVFDNSGRLKKKIINQSEIKYSTREKNKLIEKYRKERADAYSAGYGADDGGIPKEIPKGRFDGQTYIYKPFLQAILTYKRNELFLIAPSEDRTKLSIKIANPNTFKKITEVDNCTPDLIINSMCEKVHIRGDRYYQIVKDKLDIDHIEIFQIKQSTNHPN